MLRTVGMVLYLTLLATTAQAETVRVVASRDDTLIEDPAGALSNGAGPEFFAGRTGQMVNGTRRGLLYFEVARAIPPRAIIERVSLTLHALPGNDGEQPVRLHRAFQNWGEGASSAGGGSGAPSGLCATTAGSMVMACRSPGARSCSRATGISTRGWNEWSWRQPPS